MNSDYHAKIALILKENPLGLIAKNIAIKLQLPLRTTQRYLQVLIKEKKIIKNGSGPSTYYRLAELLPVFYNEDFIKKYKSIFNQSELKKLDILCQRKLNSHDLDTYNAKIYERLIIDLSWASSKLEGNTYSILETEKLILQDMQAFGKDAKETQMILNHKEAIKFLVHNRHDVGINPFTIKSVHALLSEGLLADARNQGALRDIPVGIEGSRYVPIENSDQLLICFNQFFKTAEEIKHPIELSFFLFFSIPYLQPFIDLNKRVSRVFCNVPLIKNNYIPISFVNVENIAYISALRKVYEFNDLSELKNLFIESLQFSIEKYRFIKQELKDPHPFLIKYRIEVKNTIFQVVSQNTKLEKIKLNNIQPEDHIKFKELINSELETLHEGNLIRFNLKPSDFKKWKGRW